jgi:Glycosyl transferase family 2
MDVGTGRGGMLHGQEAQQENTAPRPPQMATSASTGEVAVVIPARNAVNVLNGALACLAGQSLLPAEVVVVDDGSSDGTGALAAGWYARLPVAVVRLDTSQGPGRARHVGVTRTRSRLVTFLDADDIVLPTHLEDLSGLHARVGGIVSADGVFWYPGRGVDTARFRDHRPVGTPEHQVRDILRHNFVTIASLVSRADYDTVGGFRADFDGAEDWDLWLRLVLAGVRAHGAGTTWIYRQSPASYSRSVVTAEASLRLIHAVVPDLPPPERRIALRTCRSWRAKLATTRALEHARAGRWREARRSAMLAGLSPDRSVIRAAALLASPRAAAHVANRRAEQLWDTYPTASAAASLGEQATGSQS